MLRRLYRWNIQRKQFKLTKTTILQSEKRKKSWIRLPSRKYYFAGDGYFTFEKPARRHFYRYLFLSLTILTSVIYFLYESYLAWGLFSG